MNFDDIEIKINKPYPALTDIKEDKTTVMILKNLVSNKSGILSSVLRLIYQSVVADKTNTEIGEIFEEIGVVKITHMDMLMHAICMFGGNPKYEDAQGNIFNTGNVFYSIKLKDMLEFNIQNCNQTIQNYNNAMDKIENSSLKSLLERLKQDEENFKQTFTKILNGVQFLSI